MSDHRDELIVQYLDGSLSPEQHAVVEARLLTDPEWKAAHERLSVAAAAVRYYGIRHEVAAVHQQYVQNKPRPKAKSGLLRILRVTTAVAAAILFIFISFKGYEFYTLSTEGVYSEAYVSYTVPVTRNPSDTAFTDIETAYVQKNFAAVDSLARLDAARTEHERLLAGIASLEIKDYPKAITRLQELTTSPQAYTQDAQFYLALAYIQNRDYDLAIELMENIRANPQHTYYKQFSDGDIRDIRMLKWK